MTFDILFSSDALDQTTAIMNDPTKTGLQKQLKKAFKNLSQNPGHPGLHSHPMPQFDKLFGGAKVFSSYIQNNTPLAYRLLWVYGPKAKQITIVAAIPHY